jgi:hypothetical protein
MQMRFISGIASITHPIRENPPGKGRFGTGTQYGSRLTSDPHATLGFTRKCCEIP